MFTTHRQMRDGTNRSRTLRLESLEDRRMLAILVVTDLGDDTLANLAGDGQLSLREAVEAINIGEPVDGIDPIAGDFGDNDTILFSGALFLGAPKTLALTAGQLDLTSEVTIAGPLNNLLTIDAQQNSRIFDIAENDDDYVFNQLTLTGGLNTALGEQGGAIRSFAVGSIEVRNSYLLDNGTTGNFAPGGAVWTQGSVVLVDSEISDNRTEGTGSAGGGVFAFGDMTITNSMINGNRTLGTFSSGGGVSANGTVTLNSSTVSANEVLGPGSSAGGILAIAGLEMTESTVSGNQTTADTAGGAGVSSEGVINITRSTIVDNRALGASSVGGGVRTTDTDINVTGSIVANNVAGTFSDIDPGTGSLSVEHSLVGDTTGLTIPPATNILDQDPLLGPLAGGGLTETHSPLPGSPVIDAGDPAIVSPPAHDQRGAPFVRIADGDGVGGAVIDIGAHEVQGIQSSDFDMDGDVDGQDFLAWQRGFGIADATATDGDADDDSDVDSHDLAVWRQQYGAAPPRLGTATSPADALDAVLGIEFGDSESDESDGVALQPVVLADETARDQVFARSISASSAHATVAHEVERERASKRAAAEWSLAKDAIASQL